MSRRFHRDVTGTTGRRRLRRVGPDDRQEDRRRRDDGRVPTLHAIHLPMGDRKLPGIASEDIPRRCLG
jgi:hypothetical protein